MFTLVRSSIFSDWLLALTDAKGRAHVLARLARASAGNFGDCEPIGEGVSEMRIHYGPGYRVYFMRRDATVYVLLSGGNKASQQRDIARALQEARRLKDESQ